MTNKDKHLLAHIGETPSDLVFWSFRYFIGRRSIHASAFAQRLAFVWPFLDDRVRNLISHDIEDEFARHDRLSQSPPLSEEWQNVLDVSKQASITRSRPTSPASWNGNRSSFRNNTMSYGTSIRTLVLCSLRWN